MSEEVTINVEKVTISKENKMEVDAGIESPKIPAGCKARIVLDLTQNQIKVVHTEGPCKPNEIEELLVKAKDEVIRTLKEKIKEKL